MIWIVAVALRADGRLLALLPQPGGEPYGALAPAASRAALVGLAETWAADALPLRAETRRTVVVVWPSLDVDPSSGTLSQLVAARG